MIWKERKWRPRSTAIIWCHNWMWLLLGEDCQGQPSPSVQEGSTTDLSSWYSHPSSWPTCLRDFQACLSWKLPRKRSGAAKRHTRTTSSEYFVQPALPRCEGTPKDLLRRSVEVLVTIVPCCGSESDICQIEVLVVLVTKVLYSYAPEPSCLQLQCTEIVNRVTFHVRICQSLFLSVSLLFLFHMDPLCEIRNLFIIWHKTLVHEIHETGLLLFIWAHISCCQNLISIASLTYISYLWNSKVEYLAHTSSRWIDHDVWVTSTPHRNSRVMILFPWPPKSS